MRIVKPSFQVLDMDSEKGPKIIEQAARVCYKSDDKISDRSHEKILKNLINNSHGAMLEHAYISVKFVCDRGISHELVRHRMASFAQESTRYCNYSSNKFGNELTFIDITEGLKLDRAIDDSSIKAIRSEWLEAMEEAEKRYFAILNNGGDPQMARSVLPNSIKTEIVVTANYREWRHILNLRCAGTTGSPHPQMKEIMIGLLDFLHKEIPIVFDDIYNKVFKEKENKNE